MTRRALQHTFLLKHFPDSPIPEQRDSALDVHVSSEAISAE